MLLIGVLANRNWILGNWLKEVKQRAPKVFSIFWLPTIFSGKRWFENFIPKFLPGRQAYFFSYLTIFEKYFMHDKSKYSNNVPIESKKTASFCVLVSFVAMIVFPNNNL